MSRPGPKPLASPDEPIDYVGRLVGGKYEVRGKVGDGGMGTVFEAVNVTVGRRVALKVLRPSFAKQGEALERFQREARAATRIGHPSIIDVLDMGLTEEGLPFLVMEMLEGEELYARLRRNAPFSPSFAIRVMEQVLGALDAAHAAGIVHRDLKPENIFLVERGAGAGLVKILDFGVAKFQDGEQATLRITREGLLVGTPAYMSPEQAVAGREVDHRSDIYSAGVLLYEMLSGSLPHEGESYMQMAIAIATKDPRPLGQVATWLDPDLGAVVDKALAREPDARWGSAAELAAALEPFRGDTSVGDSSPSERLRRSSSGFRRTSRAPRRIGSGPGAAGDTGSQVTLAEEPLPAALHIPTPPPRRRLRVPLVIAGALLLAGAALFALAGRDEGGAVRANHRRTTPRAAAAPRATPAPSEGPAPSERPAPPEAPPATVDPAGAPAPTAPAVTTPETVTLDVVANVRRARVRLDGVLIGETPLREIVPRRAGARHLTVDANGYDRVDTSVELDQDRRIVVDLEHSAAPAERPAPAKVEKVAPRPAGGQLLFEQDPYRARTPPP